MDSTLWFYYFLSVIVLSLTPGPGVFSSISSGLHHGVRVGVWNAIGMQGANLVHVIVVAFGLGALLLASETVKWAGVAYLIYLGVQTWRAPVKGFEDHADSATSAREVFFKGFLVNITNPKGIIFFVAILPQFIDVNRPQLPQYAILASTTFIVDVIVMTGYTALAARVLRVMKDTRRLQWVNRTLGGAFVAAGVALASFRRAAVAAP